MRTTCKTCRRFKWCMEALRYYPCTQYERRSENAKGNNWKNSEAGRNGEKDL